MKTGIYKITNILNRDCYIGSAANLSRRWSEHKKMLRAKNHNNRHLQRAWIKYKEKNFLFEIVELCDKNQLIRTEQKWLDKDKPKYNIRKIADSNLGLKWSEESKIKQSISKKRYFKDNPISKETRLKLAKYFLNNNPRKRNDIDNKELLKLRKSGKTVYDLMDIFNCSRCLIETRLKNLDKNYKRQKPFKDINVKKMNQLLMKGWSIRKTAKFLSVSRTVIENRLKGCGA